MLKCQMLYELSKNLTKITQWCSVSVNPDGNAWEGDFIFMTFQPPNYTRETRILWMQSIISDVIDREEISGMKEVKPLPYVSGQ